MKINLKLCAIFIDNIVADCDDERKQQNSISANLVRFAERAKLAAVRSICRTTGSSK